MEAAISIKSLSQSFNKIEIFKDFNLDIEKAKITAIFGPNGCGKSTLLNILSDVLQEDSGLININNFNPYDFSYIFQNYRESLLPWRTNYKNIALPLEIQHISKDEIKQRINELQQMFDFNFDWHGYPYELSGGEQQILAFMRALVIKPKILFIDEPFSALDYENNLKLRQSLQKYYLLSRPTIILITHNIEEAIHLAQKILIFSSKPVKIIDSVDNEMLYPRETHVLKSQQFDILKDKVLSAFQKAANI